MIEIAEILKKQREAKGFTIDDLFQRTRINPDFLRALESGQFDVLPDTYVRLFVKKYAQEVGLNVEDILAEYDKNAPQKETPSPPPSSPSREINFQPAILIGIGIFIIALLIWQVRQQTNQSTATLLNATTPELPNTPPPSPATQPAPTSFNEPLIDTLQSTEPEIPTTPETPKTSEIQNPTATLSAPITTSSTQVETPPISESTSTENNPITEPPSVPPTETITSETDPSILTNDTPPPAIAEPLAEPLAEELSAISEPINQIPVTPTPDPERLITTEQQQDEPSPEAPLTTRLVTPTTMPLPVMIASGNPILLSGIAQQTIQLLVKADGRTLFDGALQAGSRPIWTARDSLELTLTNHNAIALSLQNQPLQFDPSIGPNIQISINRTQIRILPSQY